MSDADREIPSLGSTDNAGNSVVPPLSVYPRVVISRSASESDVRFYLCWLVGCFGFNGPLRQYFSLYQAVSQREGDRGEKR